MPDDIVKIRTVEQIRRSLGTELAKLLNDPRTVEIMLNPDSKLWVERLGESPVFTDNVILPSKALQILQTIASYHGRVVNEDHPILECELPLDGSRFAGQLPPCVAAPCFTIRKKAIAVFTLDDYVSSGIMTERQKEIILDVVARHKNILVIGGTGSGKTTLINAIIQAMVVNNPLERVVIIEDTGEIQCTAQNYVQFHTAPNVSMSALLKTTLRMRPDRILVGEVRGAEALDLLMAWNTGHEGGSATVHANNPRAALDRVAMMVSMARDYPKPIEPLIAEVCSFIVHIGRVDGSRKVKSILRVDGWNGDYITTEL